MRKAFTLMEVMVTTSILSLGIVMIYRSFFMSLNSSSYISNRFAASMAIANKIWEVEDSLRRTGNMDSFLKSGKSILNSKAYDWSISYKSLSVPYGLYDVDVVFSWLENNRQVRLSQSAYVIK